MFRSILSFALRVVAIGLLCVSVGHAADSAQPKLFDGQGKLFQPRKEAPAEAAESASPLRTRMAAVSSEERRVALVIGNNGYRHVNKLENAVADAHAMAREFRALGFDVIERTDVDQRAMKSAVRDFVQRVGNGGVGAFFFAGHGVQEGGNNYLLPVDIGALTDPAALADEAVELNGEVMARIGQGGAKFSLLVIDACRDNPFPRKAGRSVGGTRGLSVPATPEGMVVVYSAGVNQQALDRLGDNDRAPNSLFTREFIREMRKPGLEVAELVRNVRQRVKEQAASVRHEQTPAIYIQADRYYLIPNAQSVTIETPPSASPAIGVANVDPEAAFWNEVKTSAVKEYFDAYLKQYPRGRYVALAEVELKRIEERDKAALAEAAKQQARRDEDDLWRRTETATDAAAFQAYIDRYPTGQHIGEARRKLKGMAQLAATATVPSPTPGGPSQARSARPIPVALPHFDGDPAIAGELHSIVLADLERGGLAEIVAASGVTIAESAAIDFGEWKARGAEALVLGAIRVDADGRYETRVRVHDVQKRLQLGGKAYGHTAKQIRPTAHRISDFVTEKLTGEIGIASTRIAYLRQSSDAYELMIADSDGGNPHVALRSRQPILSPLWSADGQSIAYVSFEFAKAEQKHPHPVVLRHSLQDGKRWVCLNPPVGPRSMSFAWAPGGNSLVVAVNHDDRSVIYAVSANGTDQRVVATSNHQDTHPAISPDGRQIYFASNRSGVRRLYRISVNGGSAELVTSDNRESYAPTMSPDGQALAFLVADGGANRLALMDIATGRTAVLAESVIDEGLSFSSTGRYLMFTGWSGKARELKVLAVGKQVARSWPTTLDLASGKDFSLGPNPR